MTQLILHIGPHKTGSTYIQKALFSNRGVLGQARIDYPDFHTKPDYGHSLIVSRLTQRKEAPANGDPFEPVLQQLVQSLERGNRVIWSSENFDRLDEPTLGELKKLLPLRPQIVFFLRSSRDTLFSNWQEDIKHGATDSFKSFLYEHYSKPLKSALLNPAVVLDRYSAVFGKDSLLLMDYEEIKSQNKDVFLQFCEAFSIDAGKLTIDRVRINQALDVEVVELIRIFNVLGASRGEWLGARPRQWILSCMRSAKHKSETDFLLARIRSACKPLAVNAKGYGLNGIRSNFIKNYGDRIFEWRGEDSRADTRPVTVRCIDELLQLPEEVLAASRKLYDVMCEQIAVPQ